MSSNDELHRKPKRNSLNFPISPIIASPTTSLKMSNTNTINSSLPHRSRSLKRYSGYSSFITNSNNINQSSPTLNRIKNPSLPNLSFNNNSNNNNNNSSMILDSEDDDDLATIKVLLLGDAGVGKTAMLLNYFDELMTYNQWRLSMETNYDARHHSRSKRKRKKKRQVSIDGKNVTQDIKRFSLTDYEELLNKSGPNFSNDLLDHDSSTDTITIGDDFFIDNRATVGVDVKTDTINIDNRFFKCILWDTAGQERFRNAMFPSLFKNTNGVFLIYDISDLTSFEGCCNYWLKNVTEKMQYKDIERTRFYLIGNKSDLPESKRKVFKKDIDLAIENIQRNFFINIAAHFEVNCKKPYMIEDIFDTIFNDLVYNGCYEESDKLQNDEPQNYNNILTPQALIFSDTYSNGVPLQKSYSNESPSSSSESESEIDDYNDESYNTTQSIDTTSYSLSSDIIDISEEALILKSSSFDNHNTSNSNLRDRSHHNQQKLIKKSNRKGRNKSIKKHKVIDITHPKKPIDDLDPKYYGFSTCCT